MKTFAIHLSIGGRTKYIRDTLKQMGKRGGNIYGLTEHIGPKNGGISGCRVWIYSRQTKREIADTFFHEMTHVFFQLMAGVKKQSDSEELVASWIGWLAKAQLSEHSKDFVRNFKKKRKIA